MTARFIPLNPVALGPWLYQQHMLCQQPPGAAAHVAHISERLLPGSSTAVGSCTIQALCQGQITPYLMTVNLLLHVAVATAIAAPTVTHEL